MTLRATLPLLLATSLAACATSTPLPSGTVSELPGTWTLLEAPGLPVPPESVRLALRPAPPREGGQATLDVSGFAGVNHYRGQATLNAPQQQLIIGALTATRMAGPPERMRFEGAFLQQLEKVGSYEWKNGDTLVLRTLGGETLSFARAGH